MMLPHLPGRLVSIAGALALAAACATALLEPPPAVADTAASQNWSGYIVTRDHFRRVSGSWVVPKPSCNGRKTYSDAWVGLGGFSENAGTLEQTGTSIDCTSSGRPRYSAWYELLPAAAHSIRMTVRPGDRLVGSVAVSGTQVRIVLRNRTRDQKFGITKHMSSPNVSSAEWILEAPSDCDDLGNCRPLPLANFGKIPFSSARVTTSNGHTASISRAGVKVTRLHLVDPAGGEAITSSLSSDGSSFSVRYRATTASKRSAKSFRLIAPAAR
jgi:hypothetical protein